jgi:hypothetical protein
MNRTELEKTVFWDGAPCRLLDIDRRFRGAHNPDDGGSKHLWNVGQFLPDYTAQHPRRQPSSFSPPWEPGITPDLNCLTIMSCRRLLRFWWSTYGLHSIRVFPCAGDCAYLSATELRSGVGPDGRLTYGGKHCICRSSFVCLTTLLQFIGYIASSVSMIVNDEPAGIWKERLCVVSFKVFSGGTVKSTKSLILDSWSAPRTRTRYFPKEIERVTILLLLSVHVVKHHSTKVHRGNGGGAPPVLNQSTM